MELLTLLIGAWLIKRAWNRAHPKQLHPQCFECGAIDWIARSDIWRNHPAGPRFQRVQCANCGRRVRLTQYHEEWFIT